MCRLILERRMKDFTSPVELMKRALGFAVTVVPNGTIFVV